LNILFIRPPRRNYWDISLCVPPLGLAYVAAVARNAGHNVRILDAYALRWSWKEFEREIAKESVDVIGFSMMTPMKDVVGRAIEICRSSAKKIVVGGPHPTAIHHDIFTEFPKIDAAVCGEGEHVFIELLQWWASETGEVPKGVVVRGQAFRIASPPPIDTIPMPARELLPNEVYRYIFSTRRRVGTMITSRGCPFRCSFCDKTVSGSKWRARPAQDVVNEMQQMVEVFGIEFINIYDDNFTLNQVRVERICHEILRRKLKVQWKCEGRVDTVSLPVLRLMKKAGCQVIAYGVESGNRESLDLLRKDISIEQSVNAFSLMRQAKIKSLAYMILGVPGESVLDVQKSIQFCKDIGADYVQFSSLTAMPGTPISDMLLGSPIVSVRNPLDGDLQRQTITDLDEDQLKKLMREAWMGFYLRPHKILDLGRALVRSGYIKEGLYAAGAVSKWHLEQVLTATK
jgi:anaerobic magnesium-protoporphyrin IX monomethyl ester cyclase